MALRTAYDFETNAPNGEKIVSVADPIGSAQGAHTFYLSRRFTFPEGDYIVRSTADDAATIWIGTSQLNTRIIATPTLAVPSEVSVNIPAGQYRIDVILQNVPAEPNPSAFTLLILRNGEVFYASAKEGWLLDDQAISDDDLPAGADPRLSMPVWSILPNWENGIVERLSWMTDVLESETDAEQRRSVRRHPRRSFEVSFLRQRAQAQRMDAFFTGVGPALFLMPIFHDQVKMLDGLDMEAAGVSFPSGDLRMREFRKGDIVFVNNGDPDDYDLLEVGDMEENRFSWAFPPPRAWPVGTRIFPMRVARILTQSPKLSHITDTVSRAQVLFDQIEPYLIPPSWGAQQSGQPFFGFTVDRANPIEMEFSRKNFVLDNTSGISKVVDHGRHTTVTMQATLRLFGRSAAYRFRQFLASARGQARHFYAPTFMQNIEPVNQVIEAGTTALSVRPQGFRRSMIRPEPTRVLLAFQFRDAPTIYRSIIDVHEVFAARKLVSETMTLDAALPRIDLGDLKRISFMCETRFYQDSFEIRHPTNGHAMIETALVFRQATNNREIPQ